MLSPDSLPDISKVTKDAIDNVLVQAIVDLISTLVVAMLSNVPVDDIETTNGYLLTDNTWYLTDFDVEWNVSLIQNGISIPLRIVNIVGGFLSRKVYLLKGMEELTAALHTTFQYTSLAFTVNVDWSENWRFDVPGESVELKIPEEGVGIELYGNSDNAAINYVVDLLIFPLINIVLNYFARGDIAAYEEEVVEEKFIVVVPENVKTDDQIEE